MTLLPMAEWLRGADKARGYQMAMAVLATVASFMFLFCFATVKERIKPAIPTNDALKLTSAMCGKMTNGFVSYC